MMVEQSKPSEWQSAVLALECPLERIEFARMLFDYCSRDFYPEDGDPCLHEGLVGRRTPAVEEAFELLKLDEETQLGDFRRIIHIINNECDPYLLRKSAQWDEVKGNGMVESANDKRKRAAEIERLMFGGENTSL